MARKKKCKYHSKHHVSWWDPCVKKRIPDFWNRLSKCAWLIAVETELTSLRRVGVMQCKEKWGSTTIYYSVAAEIERVNEGKVRISPVWLAKDEGLLDIPSEIIPKFYDALIPIAKKLLKPYKGKLLPKTKRILYSYRGKIAIVSNQSPKYLWKAMERLRRLNPDLAHFIYNFAPYECNCKDPFFCEKYANVPLYQKVFDKLIVIFLGIVGRISYHWNILAYSFPNWYQREREIKESFKKLIKFWETFT